MFKKRSRLFSRLPSKRGLAIASALILSVMALSILPVSAQTWTTKAVMPTARAQVSVVSAPNGLIYAIGGYTNSTYVPVTKVEAYNLTTNSWSVKASLPNATRGAAAAVGLDGKIYVFGGYPVFILVQIYNTSTNTWTKGANIPTGVWAAGAATAPNGRIYLIGGEGADNMVQIYNPSTNTWTTGATMSTTRKEHGVVLGPDTLIYAIGGCNSSGYALSSVEAYNPATNAWTTKASVPSSRVWMGVVACTSKAYVIGGGNGAGSFLGVNEQAAGLDPLKIYVFGGGTAYSNNQPPVYSSTFVYDPATNTWATGVSMPTARREQGAAGGVLILTGKLMYNNRPLKDFTQKTPIFTVYNETTQVPEKELTISYSNSTSNYAITFPRPGTYGIYLYVDATPPFDGQQGFPGDFSGWCYVQKGKPILPYDIPLAKYLHLTSPENSSKVLKYFPYGKTYFGNITFAWDALPEATNYSISIVQYNLQPWAYKYYYNNWTSNTVFKPILPPNNKTTDYWLWFTAYNFSKYYGYTWVGTLGIVYDTGGWSEGMYFKLGSIITGTVTDATSGAALAGATVKTDYWPDYYQNTTDAKGSYSLTLPIGNYNLTVSQKGYTTNTTQVTIKAGVIKTANIKLSYIPANITGYVLDKQTGKPLRDATVKANSTIYTTGTDGKYSFSVREGTYNLTASKNGYYKNTTFVTVYFGGALVRNITLSQTTATITGTVTDSGTAAVISGANVTCGSVKTTTGADGKYSITIQPGNYQFTVTKSGYVTNTTSGTTAAGDTKTVNVALVKLAILTGTITDKKTGNPISGANVTAGGSSYATVADGSYSLSIAPGSYNLVVSKSGYVTNTTAVSVTSGTTRTVNVALKSWGIITGIVTDKDTGAFIVGATVKADSVQNTTGADGKYTLIVEAGTYTVTITKQGYDTKSTSVTVGAGASQSANLAVTPSAGFPLLLIIAGAGGAVAIAAVVLLMKRKPKPPPKPVEKVPKAAMLRMAADPTELLANGKSTSAITMELLGEEGKPIKAAEDTEVKLSATLGKITGTVTIKAGESTAKATLTSSIEFGEGKVSAESKGLKGASISLTFVERKRYCMHCGTRMALDINVCPKCGKSPPSGVDVKVCPGCGEVIPIVANFCSNCGARQPETEKS